MEEYKVYVQINEKNHIIIVDSSAFLSDPTGWIEIDHGCKYKHRHAQANYFPESIYTNSGVYRYKLADGKPVECTPDEIAQQEEANKPVEIHTAQDDTDAMLIDHEYRLTLLELGITE